jgi:hypothetical protein
MEDIERKVNDKPIWVMNIQGRMLYKILANRNKQYLKHNVSQGI